MEHPRLRRLGLLVVTISVAVPVAGAEPASAPVLRWPAVAAAVDRHPAVREASAARRAAGGAVAAAGALPNPVLFGTAGEATARGGGRSERTWSAGVGLPLDFLATRGWRVAAAEAAEEGARQDVAAARARVLRELRRAFVGLAHDQAVLETAVELEGQVAQLAALVRKRAERGEARPTEVPRIEIELERLRSAQELAMAAAEAARQRLSSWTGEPVGRVEMDLFAGPELPGLEGLRDRSLAESPIVRGARARVEAAAGSAAAERRERIPKVSVEATRADELDQRSTTLGATVSLPLWDWNGGRVRQADAALEQERARLDAAGRELAAALVEAWQGCSAGQATARRYRGEVLPRAERSARSLGRAYELGEASLLDVIDARRVLLDTRREALSRLLDMQDACADLASLAGLELP